MKCHFRCIFFVFRIHLHKYFFNTQLLVDALCKFSTSSLIRQIGLKFNRFQLFLISGELVLFHWVIKFPFYDRRWKGIELDEDVVLKVHVF